jgi:hypothetical protein
MSGSTTFPGSHPPPGAPAAPAFFFGYWFTFYPTGRDSGTR